jgi:hypothetical protein
MPPLDLNVGYRRNGKKQACEPCRKGKLACDHGAPHCGRCVRRKTTSKCIYHPAPMTRGKVPGTPTTTRVNQRADSTLANAHNQSQVQEVSHNYLNPGPVSVLEYHSIGIQTTGPACSTENPFDQQHTFSNARYPGNSQTNWKKAVYQRSSRYYGPTSFSAVFSEHQAKLNEELLFIGEDVRKHPGSWLFGEPLLGRQRPNTPVIRTTHVIKALWNIPSRETCDKLFNSFKSMHDATLDPTMISHCISSLWSTFQTELGTARANEPLAIIADVLFINEETPLPPSPDDGMEWLQTFTGRNIRFEMLGILFSFFGMAYLFLQDWDPLFSAPENEGRDRKQSAWRMKECADVCLNMCDSAETVNFLVTALIFNVKVLESGCTGDESRSKYYVSGFHSIN